MMSPTKKIITALLLTFVAVQALAKVVTLDSIAAIVNDDVITQSELETRTAMVTEQMQAAKIELPSKAIIKNQVLDRMIEQMLVLQAAERYGIKIDDQALNQALYAIAKQNNTDVEGLKVLLEKDGIHYQDFLSDLRKNLAVQRTERAVVGENIHLSSEEVTYLMNQMQKSSHANTQYRLGHILISLPQDPNEEQLAQAQSRAQLALDNLNEEKPFQQVAIEFSDSKDVLKSSDLGLRHENELPTLFSEKAVNLKLNEVAGPFRNASGLHIIKLLEVKQDEATQPYMVAESNVRHILISPNKVRSKAQAKKIIDEVHAKLQQGGDFDQLAKEYSDDIGSKQAGGKLGWVSNQSLVPPFVEAMEKLKLNQLSEPVETNYGWHVMEVLDRRTADRTAELKRNEIQEKLYERKYQEALQSWYTQLRDEAHVQMSNT